MKKQYLLAMLCFLSFWSLTAQTIIKGKVLSRSDKMPIPGATVIPNGQTDKGVATDFDGNFTVNVASPQGTLYVTSIGYAEVSHPYSGNQDIIIEMKEELSTLDEVILVGYGKNSRRTIASAVENVSLDELDSRSVKSANEYLQGQISGVTVVSNGGDPTAAPKITIRGIGTLNAEQPLWVVDGVPYFGPPINPEDIETMSVVKDASAAIYGARASAGVILVSTKSGKEGKMTVDFNTSYGIKNAYNLLYPLDAAGFADARNLAADNAGVSRDDAFNANVNPTARITKTNWIDEIFKTGSYQKYDLSLSYGNDKVNLYSSFGYLKEEGILLNTAYERYNYRLNVNYKLSNRLKIGSRINLNYSDGNGANTTSAYSGIIFTALAYPPNASIYNESNPTKFGGVPKDYASSYGDLVNPVAELLRNDIKNPLIDILVAGNLDFEVVKNLNYRFNISANISSKNYKEFEPRITEAGKPNLLNTLEQSNNLYKQILTEHILEYANTFGKHNLSLLAGYTRQKNQNEYFVVKGEDFDSEAFPTRYLINAKRINDDATQGYAWEDVLISYIGKVSYNYADKYLLNAIVRRDGSSRLYKDNQFQVFPSFSAAWNIANENFFNNTGIINQLKLRASWGQLGNVSVLGYYPSHAILSRRDGLFGAKPQLNSGFLLNEIPNKDLKWETSEQTDFGLDVSFFHNKLNFVADYYIKRTKDMLMIQDIVATAGVENPPFVNAGAVKNSGFEFSLGYRGGNAFKYHVSANFSLNNNKIEKLYNKNYINKDKNSDPHVRGLLRPIREEVGQSLHSFYGYQVDGIFQSEAEINAHTGADGNVLQPQARPGDFKFVNINGDNVINEDDKKILGNPFPKYTYSFNTGFDYKNFDFNAFFQGVAGVDAVNGLKLTGLNGSIQGYNMLEGVKDAWSPQNTDATIPILSSSDPNKNFTRFSDFYVEDASYLRLKNITLGYTIPQQIFKQNVFSKLRIYGSVDNVFTITKYSGFDPEVGFDRFGIDIGRYPQARTIIFGINAQF